MSHFFSNFIKNLYSDPADISAQTDLLSKIESRFPNQKQEDVLLIYCVAGLLTRVAYNDLVITQEESLAMEKSLSSWSKINITTAKEIILIASKEMKRLAGIENHKYCSPLIGILSDNERYALLETLFLIALSDGQVSAGEQEEIRGITKGLGLPHRYFTAARAKILHSS